MCACHLCLHPLVAASHVLPGTSLASSHTPMRIRYVTNIIALKMTFYPLEFWPPQLKIWQPKEQPFGLFGWQVLSLPANLPPIPRPHPSPLTGGLGVLPGHHPLQSRQDGGHYGGYDDHQAF